MRVEGQPFGEFPLIFAALGLAGRAALIRIRASCPVGSAPNIRAAERDPLGRIPLASTAIRAAGPVVDEGQAVGKTRW
jgi:hypothetical protein